jgi:multicomponent Na+:H+ antiporter subunit C
MSYLAYMIAGALLFCLGLFGVVARRHLLRKIIGLNVMSGGIFLLLIATARRNTIDVADPVPHAMVLTGLVVALAATAFALTLLRRIYRVTGHAVLPEGPAPP